MNNQIEMITNILYIVLIVLVVILLILGFAYIKTKLSNKPSKKKGTKKELNKTATVSNPESSTVSVNKQSIMDFMEFDTIDDNMIVQKDGKRYVMVVECQGINYDLMSSVEKDAVEGGFIQFLNTLRHPIQLYVQTRTVNLEKSVSRYQETVKQVEHDLEKLENEYNMMKDSGRYTQDQINKQFYELTRKRNLYEYGKDVIRNTEAMSLNKNVLKKQYYIAIAYYAEEANNENLDKEELKSMAFSELYTKSQAIIRTISACGVSGRILDSYGLAELLYNAYNRDEAETYGIDKAIKAGYDQLYSTAPDVLQRKMKALDEQINKRAMDIAVEEVEKVRYAKQREFENMQKNEENLIYELAKSIVEQNAEYVGEEIAKEATENLEQQKKQKQQKKKEGGIENVGQETKTRRGRKPKAAK